MRKEDYKMNKDCIFCKIAAGEIPSNTIYEDEDFRVILDLSPATKGHALVIPKEHYADLYELPEDLVQKAFLTAQKVMKIITTHMGCIGFNIVQNNGEAAGQTVHHFHIHLIPRYEDDGQQIGWKPLELSAEELKAIKDKINK